MPSPEIKRIELIALAGFPLVRPHDDLAAMVTAGLERSGLDPVPGDVLVVAQKVVSKSEGRYVELATIEPGEEARGYADRSGKDPRLVEVILRESSAVLRCVPGVLIVRHRLGFVCANAAVDASNVDRVGSDRVLLLPVDPDRSAAELRAALAQRLGVELGVIINDSFGRAWRLGTVGVAIGAAGVAAFEDLRGRADLFGRPLVATDVGSADQIASAASLLQGQAAEGVPVVLVRGFEAPAPAQPAAALVRPLSQDLFT